MDDYQLSSRYKHKVAWLKGQRTSYESTIQEISDLFTPYRGDITSSYSPGARRRPLHDSTGVLAADRLVNFLIATLFSSSYDWLALRQFGTIENNKRIQEALDATSERILDALAQSNFYVAAHAWVQDWCVLGNGTLYVQHDDEAAKGKGFGGLMFDAIPWGRVWWTFSHIGRPLCINRELCMAAIDAMNFFKENPGDEVMRKAETEPYADITIQHLVERNSYGEKRTSKKPWSSVWLVGDACHIAREGGYDECPYIAARHMILDGEQYGRGRGHIARPYCKGVNVLTHQEMLALGKEINPPFLEEEGSIESYDATPGGRIVVRPPKEMQPTYLRSGTDFAIVEQIRQYLHKQIQEAFLGDVLSEPETQTRSAMAEQSRLNRALTRVSSVNHTVVHEMLGPLIETTIDIMLKRGALPELEELGALDMQPVFSSPFFTAQKATSANRVHAFLERRLQLWERTSDPQWLEDLDPDEIRAYERDMSDVPEKIFRAQAQIEQMRQARAEQAAQDRIMEMVQGRAGRAQTQVQLRPGGSRAQGDNLTVGQGVAV